MGMIVQINSIECPCKRLRLISLLVENEDIMYKILIVIKVIIIMVKSWKKIIIS